MEHQYCLIEFEDASSNSIFHSRPGKATPEWSERFEHGFSQLIDWVLWLENQKHTAAHIHRFGSGEIQYVCLLVIGRDRHLDDPGLRERLRWRNEQVVVCSRKIYCITFDKLCASLEQRLRLWSRK